MAKYNINLIIGLIGVFLVLSGRYVDNMEKYPLLLSIVTPKYYKARTLIEDLKSGKIKSIFPKDSGFDELAEILVLRIRINKKNAPNPIIKKIDLKNISVSSGTENGKTINMQEAYTFNTYLLNSQVLEQLVWNLDRKIKERFFSRKFENLADGIFWIGIFFTLISMFKTYLSEKKEI